jgi:hypothetical protein
MPIPAVAPACGSRAPWPMPDRLALLLFAVIVSDFAAYARVSNVIL